MRSSDMRKTGHRTCARHQYIGKNIFNNATSLFGLVLLLWIMSNTASAQSFRNEWINYNKTYYRFAVTPTNTVTGVANNHTQKADYNLLHRIPYATLLANGLAGTPVEHFQLIRNGVEVPMYTYPASGIMSSDGYLEFWGKANDGQTDKDLFRNTANQLNDRWSMFSDTAYYYLTVNTETVNQRIISVAHNPLASSLTPDSFFMHSILVSPRSSRNLGFAINIQGKDVRSSSFEAGEGWADVRFGSSPFTIGLGKLFSFKNTTARISASYWAQGLSNANKTYEMRLNDSILGTRAFRRYNPDSAFYNNIPLSRINASDSTNITIRLNALDGGYRHAISKVRFTYPRKFEFDKTTAAFVFSLPASAGSKLLKWVNFDTSNTEKILIDETNKQRYVGVRVADTLWFEILPSAIDRQLILTSVDLTPAKNIVREIATLTPRNFTSYANVAQEGDYLIISNNRLHNYNGSDPVEAYRAYRSTPAGGGYNAKVYAIEDLTEQFGFNIYKHPLAIRNFLRYSRYEFGIQPKAILLMGRGSTYDYSYTDTNIARLNLVPTWGQPASDNLLAAADNESITPATPIGRIAAITGEEVQDYLNKVVAFETAQADNNQSQLWQKETLHLIGGNDPFIVDPIKGYMQKYENRIKDTLIGSRVQNFIRLNDPNTSANNLAIQQSVQAGTGIISYFGHSSATSFDFNLNDPTTLNYTTGRLPVFLANGCKASEFFDLNPRRYNQSQLTLSERFVLTKEKGSIAFISSTHYGILQYLDVFTEKWYDALATTHYAKSIGEIHKQAIQKMLETTTLSDPAARLTAEEYHLHGDPVLRIHTQLKPDYKIDSNSIIISPAVTTANTDSVSLQFTVDNQGMATTDTAKVSVYRRFADNREMKVADTLLINLSNSRQLQFRLPVGGKGEAGNNSFVIRIDEPNAINEALETNNNASKQFIVANEGMQPIWPLNYGIVNTWPTALFASPFDITADSATYRLQIDTTTAFNSPSLYQLDTTSRNGAVQFLPANTLQAGKVYYWRTTVVKNGNPGAWSQASFTYLPGSGVGFNQGHYYQQLRSSYSNMLLDANRKYRYVNKFNNLYITHGIYPFSATEDLHLSITPNGNSNIYSACIGQSIIVNVFDSLSFIPYTNPAQVNGTVGGCAPNTGGRIYNYEFKYFPAANRKRIMDFIDSIPTGQFVSVRLVVDPPYDSIKVNFWKRDTTLYGSGNSLYHTLLRQGFTELDSLNRTRTFSFVFKKNDSIAFKPTYLFSEGLNDLPVLSVDLPMTDTLGSITSPWFGPASSWDSLYWAGLNIPEPNGQQSDTVRTTVIGRKKDGTTQILFTLNNTQQAHALVATNSIDAAVYPYIQLRQTTADSDNATPYPLDYWRVIFDPAPEGVMQTGEYFSFTTDTQTGLFKDTLLTNIDTLRFGVAFRNISTGSYADSLVARIHLEDSLGNKMQLLQQKLKPLAAGDSLHLFFERPLENITGPWKLYASINADGAQSEISLDNNFVYLPFYAKYVSVVPGNSRVFEGTGNWSDSARWTPYGLPQCNEKVYIRGNCVVNIANAVSDSLFIEKTGRLEFANGSAMLNVGCSADGGGKLATVKGTLVVSDGLFHINGGLLFADSSRFYQSGGRIVLDPNNGDSATSMRFGNQFDALNREPLAVLSFGGLSADTSAYKPYVQGIIEAIGGSIEIIDPPMYDSMFTFFFSNVDVNNITFDSAHQLVLGSTNVAITDSSRMNQFLIQLDEMGGDGYVAFGKLIIKANAMPGRKVVLRGPTGIFLRIRGGLRLEDGAILELKDGLELKLEYE